MSHFMQNGRCGAGSGAADNLFAAHHAFVGLADSAGVAGIKIEVDVVSLAGVGHELNDARKRIVERGDGIVEVGQISRRRVDGVRNLSDAADFRPKISVISYAHTQALRTVGRCVDVIEENVALIDRLAAAIFFGDPCVSDLHASPKTGAKFGLLGLAPEGRSDYEHK